MTVNKLYTSLPANHITAKQTNHVQQTRLYNIIDWQSLSTWLWRWLPHRLSKRQLPTTVLFRTTLNLTITLYELRNVLQQIRGWIFLLGKLKYNFNNTSCMSQINRTLWLRNACFPKSNRWWCSTSWDCAKKGCSTNSTILKPLQNRERSAFTPQSRSRLNAENSTQK